MRCWMLPCLAMGFLLLFAACTPADRFVAGEELGREELASVSEALLATETAGETELAIETLADAEGYPDGVVHWTAGGSVYHTRVDCYHLARAEVVYHGFDAAARMAGKERLCSACEKAEETD